MVTEPSAENASIPEPWPIVGECHYPAPSLVKQGHECPQIGRAHV